MMDTTTTTMNSTIASATVDNSVRMYTDTLTGEQRTALEAGLRNERARFGVIDDTDDTNQCYMGHFSIVEFNRRSVVDELKPVERIYIQNAFDDDLDEDITVFTAFYMFCLKYGNEYIPSDEWLYWDWYTIPREYHVDNDHEDKESSSWFDGDDYNMNLQHFTELVHTVRANNEDELVQNACDMLLRLAEDTRAITVYRMEALRDTSTEQAHAIPVEFYEPTNPDFEHPANTVLIGNKDNSYNALIYLNENMDWFKHLAHEYKDICDAASDIYMPESILLHKQGYGVFEASPDTWNEFLCAIINDYELYKYYNGFSYEATSIADEVITRAKRLMIRKVQYYTDNPEFISRLDDCFKIDWEACKKDLGYTQS